MICFKVSEYGKNEEPMIRSMEQREAQQYKITDNNLVL
jgi:hypothetical protein